MAIFVVFWDFLFAFLSFESALQQQKQWNCTQKPNWTSSKKPFSSGFRLARVAYFYNSAEFTVS